MIHLFVNGWAASAGGGLTYLRNVIPCLAARTDVRVTVLVNSSLRQEFAHFPNIEILEGSHSGGTGRRFLHEQRELPEFIRHSGAEVLLSCGNFALRKSPVPQILLSRNSLYTSPDFARDLRSRCDYSLLFDTKLKGLAAKRSIQWADRTVAPSEAFAQELRQWTGRDISAVHHGFDHEAFFRDNGPLPQDVQKKLQDANDAVRILFVSHYNYYRNFETLLRTVPLLQQRLGPRGVRLFLTCTLHSEANPGAYRAEGTANLVRQLGIESQVVELGSVPYHQLHQLYRACDVYVTPAYAESFAHPLVEAMASGLPIAASDLAVHREICGDAALYFPRFSPEEMASQIERIANSSQLKTRLAAQGQQRSLDFSWNEHVNQILRIAGELRESRFLDGHAA